jgi:uncharacterized protein
MLSTILRLFGHSPFAPLFAHMKSVSCCVHQLLALYDAIDQKEYEKQEKLAQEISKMEHDADLIKNDIRNHLPKSLYLPIDRADFLKILAIQDAIADKAEDFAVLSILKPLELLPIFKDEFKLFLLKNIETFDKAMLIVKELHELLETSFGGVEAEKVRAMVDIVAYHEHEADILQRRLLKKLFSAEDQLTYVSFHLWQRLFESLASISNLSENLAYQIRMTLELK